MTVRQVEDISRWIAEERQNQDFLVSNAWLTELENHSSVPSLCKLYSLSVAYRVPLKRLLKIFGIDLDLDLPLLPVTASIQPAQYQNVTISADFRHGNPALETTSLLQNVVDLWGDIPWQALQCLDVRHGRYGFVGTKDYTMFPLIRPGSLVEIDGRTTLPQACQWSRELDRPIYFVEMRQGYACSWCDLQESVLTLIPHPLSSCQTRQYSFPSEAEIVGQVIGVAMSLVPSQETESQLVLESIPHPLPQRG